MAEACEYKKSIPTAGGGAVLSDRAADMACGFLMVRGAAAGVYSAGWSMTALTGGSAAAVMGALMFAAGCAAVMLLRRDYGRGVSAATDILASAVFLLWRLTVLTEVTGTLVFECAAVILMLAAVHSPESWRSAAAMCVSAAVILTAAVCIPLSDGLWVLRLSALCGEMAAAGLCGTALTGLICPGEHHPLWLAAGAALAMM